MTLPRGRMNFSKNSMSKSVQKPLTTPRCILPKLAGLPKVQTRLSLTMVLAALKVMPA